MEPIATWARAAHGTIGIAPDKDVAMEAYGGFKEKKKRGKKTRASAKRSR